MDSALEKITLYDLFGYLIPGLLYATMACFAVGVSWDRLTDASGLIVLMYILISYILGCVISELSARISCKIFSLGKKSEKHYYYYKNILENTNISIDELESVLRLNHIVVRKEDKENYTLGKYFYAMFADLQVDSSYKRLHNYASYAGMLKNLLLAYVLGLFMILALWIPSNYFYRIDILLRVLFGIVSFVVIFVLMIRYRRFAMKKDEYTALWYMHKYNNKIQEKDVCKKDTN